MPMFVRRSWSSGTKLSSIVCRLNSERCWSGSWLEDDATPPMIDFMIEELERRGGRVKNRVSMEGEAESTTHLYIPASRKEKLLTSAVNCMDCRRLDTAWSITLSELSAALL